MNIVRILYQTMRPRQWIKSIFILAPALFTLKLLHPDVWSGLAYGLTGFSLVASAVYALNDIANRKEDRLHPVKKYRPTALGVLPVWGGALISATSLTIGLLLLRLAKPETLYWGTGYFLLMTLYTFWFRRVMILDVIVIAVGFVIRVEAGAVIIHEPASHWLLLCTFTIALFLALIKRRQELFQLEGDAGRTVLGRYPSLTVLDGWISVVAGMTILCYALYTVDPVTIAKHATDRLIWTVPFALYGIFRYHHLALIGRAGEDPARIVLTDNGIRLTILLWGIAVWVILWGAK